MDEGRARQDRPTLQDRRRLTPGCCPPVATPGLPPHSRRTSGRLDRRIRGCAEGLPRAPKDRFTGTGTKPCKSAAPAGSTTPARARPSMRSQCNPPSLAEPSRRAQRAPAMWRRTRPGPVMQGAHPWLGGGCPRSESMAAQHRAHPPPAARRQLADPGDQVGGRDGRTPATPPGTARHPHDGTRAARPGTPATGPTQNRAEGTTPAMMAPPRGRQPARAPARPRPPSSCPEDAKAHAPAPQGRGARGRPRSLRRRSR